jgi:HSP20 family protein
MENKNSYIIELGAPGFEKKNISISVKNNNLYVHGERNLEEENHDDRYSHREFNINTFHRSFQLPTEIDEDHIDAKFLNGMLTITLPKNKNAASALRKIEIH